LQKIKQLIGPIEPDAWKTTVNRGVIETANKTPNKVPGDARAILDIRFTETTAKTPEELTQKIKALVPEVNVSAVASIAPSFVKEDNEFLQQFKKTAEEVLGYEAEIGYGHGTTDARYFAEAGAIAIVFGARGENMHAAGEWVDLESLEKNKEILLKFLS
jgi:acetylornithine deacetylase/succinyl-diaminopimelate desuccinylase-like protein